MQNSTETRGSSGCSRRLFAIGDGVHRDRYVAGLLQQPVDRRARDVALDEPEIVLAKAGQRGREQRGRQFVVDVHIGESDHQLAVRLSRIAVYDAVACAAEIVNSEVSIPAAAA